ncbi:MAG: biopolymer transporter ExbD [Gemmatimonadota bacterium]|jgi:biopolymer transport protein ExbD/biopolymer transport protein TolR|nr:biopolymer transporter ExbD [Gemmatimonadota bacterium]
MRRRGRGERTPLNAEINVVSLIDVMMLLMIIFMITAPMMQGGVDVSLPKAEARPLNSKSALVISVTRDGSIYADEVKLSLSEFRGSFKSLAAQTGREGVYLRADQGVPYGRVVEVLAIMRAAGVGNIGLVAEPEDVAK